MLRARRVRSAVVPGASSLAKLPPHTIPALPAFHIMYDHWIRSLPSRRCLFMPVCRCDGMRNNYRSTLLMVSRFHGGWLFVYGHGRHGTCVRRACCWATPPERTPAVTPAYLLGRAACTRRLRKMALPSSPHMPTVARRLVYKQRRYEHAMPCRVSLG